MLKRIILVSFILSILLFALGSPDPSEDYTQRATCECYYKFENAGDLGEDEQNQIDLTNNGVAQSVDIPSGTYASPSTTKSAEFVAASEDDFFASHADSTEIDDLTAITGVLWIKRVSSQLVSWLIHKGGLACYRFYTQFNATKRLRIDLGGDDTKDDYTFNQDTWYFVAFTYSQASDFLTIYVGTEEVQVSVLEDLNKGDLTMATADDFYIGSKEGSEWFDGLMAEVAIFSEKLSLSDLKDIQQYGMEGTEENAIFFGVNFLVKK